MKKRKYLTYKSDYRPSYFFYTTLYFKIHKCGVANRQLNHTLNSITELEKLLKESIDN